MAAVFRAIQAPVTGVAMMALYRRSFANLILPQYSSCCNFDKGKGKTRGRKAPAVVGNAHVRERPHGVVVDVPARPEQVAEGYGRGDRDRRPERALHAA